MHEIKSYSTVPGLVTKYKTKSTVVFKIIIAMIYHHLSTKHFYSQELFTPYINSNSGYCCYPGGRFREVT